MRDVRRMRLGGSLALPEKGGSLGADRWRGDQLIDDQQENQERK